MILVYNSRLSYASPYLKSICECRDHILQSQGFHIQFNKIVNEPEIYSIKIFYTHLPLAILSIDRTPPFLSTDSEKLNIIRELKPYISAE